MEREAVDVIILGAGVGGLAAARTLRRAGLIVTVLEARDRVGGRVHTIREPFARFPVELGAEFVHGVPDEILDIVKAAGLPLVESSGDNWCVRDDGPSKCDFWSLVGEVFEKLPGPDAEDVPFRTFLSGLDAGEGAELANRFVEGFHAADPDLVGVRYLSDAESGSEEVEGKRAFRVLDGYDRVVEWLAEGLGDGAFLFLY